MSSKISFYTKITGRMVYLFLIYTALNGSFESYSIAVTVKMAKT